MYDCTHVYKCKFIPQGIGTSVHVWQDLSIVYCRLPSCLLAEQFLGSVLGLIHNHAYAYVPLINSMLFQWRSWLTTRVPRFQCLLNYTSPWPFWPIPFIFDAHPLLGRCRVLVVGRERLLVAAGLEFIPLYRHYEKTPPVLLIRHQSLFVMNKSRIAHVWLHACLQV